MRFVLCSGLILSAAFVVADEPPAKPAKPDPVAAAKAKAEVKMRIEKYLDSGTPGVFYSEEKDTKEGRIERVYIVGTSRISAVLGDEEGLEIARERAEESAKTEFVKWLGSQVTVRKTVNNEILLTKEGAENPEGAATKEVGKRVERRTKDFEETASGVVRGLKPVGTVQLGKEKKIVIVYRWEAKAPNIGGKDASPADPKPDSKLPAKKPEAKIPDKKVIIDD